MRNRSKQGLQSIKNRLGREAKTLGDVFWLTGINLNF